MAHYTLVESEIQDGRDLVELLDKNNFDVQAAFWFYSSEEERWRFIVVTPLAAEGVTLVYQRASDAGALFDVLERTSFVPPTAKVALAMNDVVKVRAGERERRLRGYFSHDVFIEDAIVFRTAA